jgi:hypothetical protein
MEQKTIELENFISSYPYIENGREPTEFYPYLNKYEKDNFDKLEFFEDILPIKEEKPEQKGIPLKHQELLARFMSPKTLNDEMLLFHQVGTGKTCTAINIAELAMSMNPNLKVIVLVKGETIAKNFINELAFQCTPGQYIPENYEKLTKNEKATRLNKNIRTNYEIHTFYTFAKNIKNIKNDKLVENQFSNKIIIMDEVHNIREYEQEKKGEKVYVYKELHRFLHIIKNRKILLMSATPMKDNVTEFASIMNLILPLDTQLPIGKQFIDTFFQDENQDENQISIKIKNEKQLKQLIRGKISVLRAMESDLIKMNIGETINELKYTKLDVDTMSNFQSQVYIEALRKDTSSVSLDTLKSNENINDDINSNVNISPTEDKELLEESEEVSGLYDNSRQASLFVFPNKTYGSKGFNDPENIKSGKEGKSGQKAKFTDKLINILTKNKTLHSPIDLLNEIGKYSSKYKKTLQDIVLNPKENCFVYSKFVKGSGLIVFSELLKLFGYKEATGNEELSQEGQVLRFGLLTGKITESIEKIIKKFNSPENRHGKLIQVLLGSPLVSEGRSFKNIRQIHILTPHWNISETEQATGRGIRAFSHNDLDKSERNVKVYRHCSLPESKLINSIDYIMYKKSEDKDIKVKQIERLCKETAVDCAFNKKRNSLDTDIDGSRECEYQTCKYTCDNLSEEYINQNVNQIMGNNSLTNVKITDTYNLFYGEHKLKSTINLIQQLFKRKFFMHIKELMTSFYDIPFMLLIRALKYMIQNYIPVINTYGFVSYIKYERNVFFLTDQIQSSNSFYINNYCQFPVVNVNKSFKSIILENQSNNSDTIIEYINKLDLSNESNIKKVTNLILEFNINLQEQLIELSIFSKILEDTTRQKDKSLEKKDNKLRDLVLKIFNQSILNLPNMYISRHYIDTELYRFIYKNAKNIDEWQDINKDVLESIKDIEIEKEQDIKNIEDTDFNFYGIITKDQKFKIKQTRKSYIEEFPEKVYKKKKDTDDKIIDERKIPGGSVCTEMVPVKNIINVILRLADRTEFFNYPVDYEFPSKDELNKTLLKIGKYTDEELSKLNTEKRKIAFYILREFSKGLICGKVRNFFEQTNLIVFE